MSDSYARDEGAGPLFEPRKLARATDPDASKSAAAAASELRAAHFKRIEDALAASPEPMTAEMIADAAGTMDKVEVCRRFAELVRAGRIKRIDENGRNRSGRKAGRYLLNL